MSDQQSSNGQNQSGSQTGNSTAQQGGSNQSTQGNNQATNNAAPQRPASVNEAEWDAATSRPNEKFYERINGVVARDAEAQVRENTRIKDEAGFALKNSDSFKLPEGTSFQFDAKSPDLAQLRKFAIAHKLDQAAFSGILDLYVQNKIGEQQTQATLRQTNLDQLGAAGPQRVAAVATWLQARAGEDGARTAEFLTKFPSAPIVKTIENLMRQFSNQGGTDYSQQHRETQEQEAGKIPGYDNMNFVQRRAHQMAQKLNSQNAGGAGR